MNRFTLISCLAGFILLISSCSPIFYAPTGFNIPGEVGKGEAEIRGGYHVGDVSGLEGQILYGLDSNWMISGNVAMLNYTREDAIVVDGNSNMFELGCLYQRKINNNISWGIKPSVLNASFHIDAQTNTPFPDMDYIYGKLNSRFISLRILPFVKYNGKLFGAYLGTRMAGLNYYDESGLLFDGSIEQKDYLRSLDTQWFFEPGGGLSFGRRGWSLFSEFVISFPVNNPELPIDPAVWLTGLRWNPSLYKN
ncbi:MAG: hypothetical protein H6606_03405 [Flavobacteriales bacterium]|nr:hypothetical protein [Flavobacteriales bacterium]